MEYNIIIGLGEGLIYDKQTTSRSFLAYEKKLAKQLHFHSDLSSTLRFSQQIASKSSTRCSPFVKAVLHPIFV